MASKAYVVAMTVSELKEELKQRGMSTKGSKKDLRDRLEQALYDEELDDPSSESESESGGHSFGRGVGTFDFVVQPQSFIAEEDLLPDDDEDDSEDEDYTEPMTVSIELSNKEKLEVCPRASATARMAVGIGDRSMGDRSLSPMIVQIEMGNRQLMQQGSGDSGMGRSVTDSEGTRMDAALVEEHVAVMKEPSEDVLPPIRKADAISRISASIGINGGKELPPPSGAHAVPVAALHTSGERVTAAIEATVVQPEPTISGEQVQNAIDQHPVKVSLPTQMQSVIVPPIEQVSSTANDIATTETTKPEAEEPSETSVVAKTSESPTNVPQDKLLLPTADAASQSQINEPSVELTEKLKDTHLTHNKDHEPQPIEHVTPPNDTKEEPPVDESCNETANTDTHAQQVQVDSTVKSISVSEATTPPASEGVGGEIEHTLSVSPSPPQFQMQESPPEDPKEEEDRTSPPRQESPIATQETNQVEYRESTELIEQPSLSQPEVIEEEGKVVGEPVIQHTGVQSGESEPLAPSQMDVEPEEQLPADVDVHVSQQREEDAMEVVDIPGQSTQSESPTEDMQLTSKPEESVEVSGVEKETATDAEVPLQEMEVSSGTLEQSQGEPAPNQEAPHYQEQVPESTTTSTGGSEQQQLEQAPIQSESPFEAQDIQEQVSSDVTGEQEMHEEAPPLLEQEPLEAPQEQPVSSESPTHESEQTPSKLDRDVSEEQPPVECPAVLAESETRRREEEEEVGEAEEAPHFAEKVEQLPVEEQDVDQPVQEQEPSPTQDEGDAAQQLPTQEQDISEQSPTVGQSLSEQSPVEHQDAPEGLSAQDGDVPEHPPAQEPSPPSAQDQGVLERSPLQDSGVTEQQLPVIHQEIQRSSSVQEQASPEQSPTLEQDVSGQPSTSDRDVPEKSTIQDQDQDMDMKADVAPDIQVEDQPNISQVQEHEQLQDMDTADKQEESTLPPIQDQHQEGVSSESPPPLHVQDVTVPPPPIEEQEQCKHIEEQGVCDEATTTVVQEEGEASKLQSDTREERDKGATEDVGTPEQQPQQQQPQLEQNMPVEVDTTADSVPSPSRVVEQVSQTTLQIDDVLVHAEEDDLSVFSTEAAEADLALTNLTSNHQSQVQRSSSSSGKSRSNVVVHELQVASSRASKASSSSSESSRLVSSSGEKRSRQDKVEAHAETTSIKRRRISTHTPGTTPTATTPTVPGGVSSTQERKRRWGSAKQRSNSTSTPTANISSDVLKDIIPPDMEGIVIGEGDMSLEGEGEEQAKESGDETTNKSGGSAADREWEEVEKERELKRREMERARQELETRRRIEARLRAKQEANEKARRESIDKDKRRTPSPARNPKSRILHVENLTRPFTKMQLIELLTEDGPIIEDSYWTNRVKSHCIVVFKNLTAAVATRQRLHGIKWPSTNPKRLTVDYLTPDRVAVITEGQLVIDPISEGEEEVEEVPVKEEGGEPMEGVVVAAGEVGAVKDEEGGGADGLTFGELVVSSSSNQPEVDDSEVKVKPTADTEGASVPTQPLIEPPKTTKLLDELFRKTKATPSIYWLPLTDAQIAEREAEECAREEEREKQREERARLRREEREREDKERERRLQAERERRAKERMRRRRSRSRSQRSRSRSQSRSRSRDRGRRRR